MDKAIRPELHQLEIFLRVVESRSFAGAARTLRRSQPAVSQAIARLETIYGGDLFERRRGSPLKLTPIGEAILPSARTIIDTIDQQMARAVATAQSYAGSLSFGLFPGLLSGQAQAGIANFIARSPQVHLRLVEALSGELHRQLNERSIDLMLVALMPRLDSKTLVQERLWQERLVIALPADHRFAQNETVGWESLAEIPLILKQSYTELAAYRALLDREGQQVNLDQHDVSCATLLDMVNLGMGATIVFASSVVPHRGVVFLPIKGDNATVAVDAVWPKDDRNPLRHRLLSAIRDHRKDELSTSGSNLNPSNAQAPDRG